MRAASPAKQLWVCIREGRKIIISVGFKVILYILTLRNGAGRQKLFKELFEGHVLQWILAVLVVSFLIWLVVWIVGCFRENEDRHVDASELLLQFSEMRREGDLTDDEFRSIRKRLVDSTEKGLEKKETTDQTENAD
ncbi:hypothetical protein [uncultured Gimesia sp.]|uniref:hypothetical protein n=1 Tax=uncultured Gimesia sp. TaxID=1678688 RepID=UPI0030D94FF0|tara:strand:+ start:140387 stop:140797 length:411 start_codon:yes stop_codon:yes gene_type:complete